MIRHWFQNLKRDDRSKRWFHFRGALWSNDKKIFSYEVSSGLAIRLWYQHGECGDSQASSQISLGLLLFTIYVTFYLPDRLYFHKKCVATWDNNREFSLVEGKEYGFYIYRSALSWKWHAKVNESSSRDPWWMSQYIHLDELILGKKEVIKDELVDISHVKFALGDKEFTMDRIGWIRYRRFRTRIPYALYHSQDICVDMKIDKPPMTSGKGENSWDCGDDGTYGSHQPWPFEAPNWTNRTALAEKAIGLYVDDVFRDLKKYGGARGDRGINRESQYRYIGIHRSQS